MVRRVRNDGNPEHELLFDIERRHGDYFISEDQLSFDGNPTVDRLEGSDQYAIIEVGQIRSELNLDGFAWLTFAEYRTQLSDHELRIVQRMLHRAVIKQIQQ